MLVEVEKIKYALVLYALKQVESSRRPQTMYCSLLQGNSISRVCGKCSLITGRYHSSFVLSVLVYNHNTNLAVMYNNIRMEDFDILNLTLLT